MGKLVGFDIGENSVKMVYFSGRELKRAITAELPDAMVSNGRILSMDAMADFIRDMAKGYGIPLTNAAMVLNTGDHFVRSVTLPLMTPWMISALALSLSLSMGELGATVMIYPPGWTTLPVTIFSLTDRGNIADGSALTIVLVGVTLLLMMKLERIARRLSQR